jgi:uncharacterized protein involved in tolerance to divalent cations
VIDEEHSIYPWMVILVEDTERGAIFKVDEDEASADAEMLEATDETADKSTS